MVKPVAASVSRVALIAAIVKVAAGKPAPARCAAGFGRKVSVPRKRRAPESASTNASTRLACACFSGMVRQVARQAAGDVSITCRTFGSAAVAMRRCSLKIGRGTGRRRPSASIACRGGRRAASVRSAPLRLGDGLHDDSGKLPLQHLHAIRRRVRRVDRQAAHVDDVACRTPPAPARIAAAGPAGMIISPA